MKTFILENYLLIVIVLLSLAAVLTVVSTFILQKGAEYGTQKDSEMTRGKINDGVNTMIEQVRAKFNETSESIGNNAKSTIENINLQGQAVIHELSEQSKKELDSLRNDIKRIQDITDRISVSSSTAILELEYIIPIKDFPRTVSFQLAQILSSNYSSSMTIIRDKKGIVASFVGLNQPFKNIDLNRARQQPIDFKKENVYIVYLGDNWMPEKDNYYLKFYFAFQPDTLDDFSRLQLGDGVNFIRNQVFGHEFQPLTTFFKLKPVIKRATLKLGQTTYNLESSRNLFTEDKLYPSQIIHHFTVIK